MTIDKHSSDQRQMYDDYKEKQRRKYAPDGFVTIDGISTAGQEVEREWRRRRQHEAAQYLKSHRQPTQPALDDGEWRVEALPTHGWRIVDATGQEIVADAYRREDARQIVAEHNAAQRLTVTLDSQEFYELMQAYRHASLSDQSAVVTAFEAVKAFIRNPATTTTQPDAGEGR